jgi:hypothetical protein
MSIRWNSFVVALAILLCCVSLAVAGDQDRDQDRLKDGSCQDDAIESGSWKVVAADQDRDRDRLKDGSCQDDAIEGGTWKVVAAEQKRTRDQDRLKDGSCKG